MGQTFSVCVRGGGNFEKSDFSGRTERRNLDDIFGKQFFSPNFGQSGHFPYAFREMHEIAFREMHKISFSLID